MYQFFVEENQFAGDRISIQGSDVNHIKNVLRMKCGERVRVSISYNGRSFFGIIDSIMDDEVIVTIESEDENGTELSNRIYLFQGLPKGDKMELIIQKAVELGVYEIIPIAMKNCVVKLDDKKAGNKIKRWNAISESAAKQSKRTLIPEVQMPLTWKEAMKKQINGEFKSYLLNNIYVTQIRNQLSDCMIEDNVDSLYINSKTALSNLSIETI